MSDSKFLLKMSIRAIVGIPVIIGGIFLLAGRIDYWQGWVFTSILLILVIISGILNFSKLDLIKERMKPGSGTKWWDKIFWAFYAPLNFALLIVAVLDAGRYRWTGRHPFSSGPGLSISGRLRGGS